MSAIKLVASYLLYLEKFREISKSVQLIAIGKLRKLRARIEARECALSFAVELFEEWETEDIEYLSYTVLVITSDRSCCGKLNGDVLSASREVIDEYLDDNKIVRIVTVGRIGYASLVTTYKSNVCKRVTATSVASFFFSYVITLCLLDTHFDKCLVVFSKYYKIFEQAASFYEFQSFSILHNYLYANRKQNLFFDLLLSTQCISLRNLYAYNICVVVLDAFEETKYSELGCRAFSMELASRNATKLIKEKRLLYNKLRQECITTALMEVVSGAIYS